MSLEQNLPPGIGHDDWLPSQGHTPEPWVYEAGRDNYGSVDMHKIAGSNMATTGSATYIGRLRVEPSPQ